MPANRQPTVLTVVEWHNLLDALRTVVKRYGINEVEDALEHLRATGE